MKRRNFLKGSALSVSGFVLSNSVSSYANNMISDFALGSKADSLYEAFKNPNIKYKPYVRWWWNGDKVEKKEISRELKLLKDAGIGGVEINPIAFPNPQWTDDMGIPSIQWLSDEWIDLLAHAFKEADALQMKCDLLVGTGFPFGGKFLDDDQRAQIVVIAVKKMEGPVKKEYSLFDLYKEADPQITNDYSGRQMEMLSVQLVPDPMNSVDEVIDLSDQIEDGTIKVSLSEGKYALYALVKVNAFEHVIVGAPGGNGPLVNHFDKKAVNYYLNRMSEKIKEKTGAFPSNFRSFFVDSMELEGANWNDHMLAEFKKKRGYDIEPFLPYILFKIGRMGANIDPDYVVDTTPEFSKTLERMRYDWAVANAEIFRETFVDSYAQWCTDNKVKSRAQAYGRGYYLLEGSFPIDIPECETWLKYGIGKDIPEDKFTQYPWHLGEGNTMINKYVSSAAHLKNKRLISSEELTNTQMVFNESLEIFKIAGDQSTISGVTQPVFHGFNYSPPDAPFPGWIRWGGYFNEKNTMWPYLHLYVEYRTRLSALLQQGDMFADIAILPAVPDMWEKYGAQMEPFPKVVYPDYQMLIWESLHENGQGCDYISQRIIDDAKIEDGYLKYGDGKYKTVFLIKVQGLAPSAAEKLHQFVSGGGRVFCIETFPDHSPGWKNHSQKDEEVREWVQKMKKYPDRFIFLNKPKENFCGWISRVQEKYNLSPYVKIKRPRRYIRQMRYQMKDTEVFFFINSSDSHEYLLDATFSKDITNNKNAWLWNAQNGKRYQLDMKGNKLQLPLGPATSAIIVFDKNKGGEIFQPAPVNGDARTKEITGPWNVKLNRYDGNKEETRMQTLTDLKETDKYKHFAGTAEYEKSFQVSNSQKFSYLNLGDVYGIAEVTFNGKKLPTTWYGDRVYNIEHLIHNGENKVKVKVVTVMVNYMKTLKDNKIAQFWTNEGRKDQPLQSLGLAGPVQIY